MHNCSGCLCHAKPLKAAFLWIKSTLTPPFNILQISNCWKFGKKGVAKISKFHQTTCEHRTSFQVDLLFCRWFKRKRHLLLQHRIVFPSVLDKKMAHYSTPQDWQSCRLYGSCMQNDVFGDIVWQFDRQKYLVVFHFEFSRNVCEYVYTIVIIQLTSKCNQESIFNREMTNCSIYQISPEKGQWRNLGQ